MAKKFQRKGQRMQVKTRGNEYHDDHMAQVQTSDCMSAKEGDLVKKVALYMCAHNRLPIVKHSSAVVIWKSFALLTMG